MTNQVENGGKDGDVGNQDHYLCCWGTILSQSFWELIVVAWLRMHLNHDKTNDAIKQSHGQLDSARS